jgi:hypothetical protein
MFGMKLKSWMEAHLGRPRHKSTSHQKNQKSSKDSSASAASSSSTASVSGSTTNTTAPGTTATNNIGGESSTGLTVEVAAPNNIISSSAAQAASVSSSNPPNSTHNPYHLPDFGHNRKDSNADFPQPEGSSTSQSYSKVVVGQSEVQHGLIACRTQHAQHPKHENRIEVGDNDTIRILGEDQEEKGQSNNHHLHHEQSSCPRSSTCNSASVSHSTSNSILLGSFSNNLSSPDTGYSTDGYSPKSVYPALSFESSGKSTPKSSYTISSLVSSELLHSSSSKNTASLSSASCSVQNGLDLDHECISPIPAATTTTSRFSTDHQGMMVELGRNPKGNASLIEPQSSSSLAPLHSINYGTSMKNEEKLGQLSPLHCSSQDSSFSRGNDTVSNKQYDSNSPSASYINEVSSSPSPHNKNAMGVPSTTTFSESTMMTLANSQNPSIVENESCKPGDFSGSSGPTSMTPRTSSQIHPNNYHSDIAVSADCVVGNLQASLGYERDGICRADNSASSSNMDGRKSTEASDARDGNSSSKLTGANRNIRTSFVLASSSSASQITECNPRIKNNPFSICSPRKERTKIKTNPWITVNQISHDGIGNSNANAEVHESEQQRKHELKGSCSQTIVSESRGSKDASAFSQPLSSSASSSSKPTKFSPRNDNTNNNPMYKGVGGNVNLKINNMKSETEERSCNNRSTAVVKPADGMDHPHDPSSNSSIVYRTISTSASASDSGKGSLEPGTNRNSTESSYLLSDSASPRNSIISHEAEPEGSCCESRSRSSSAATDTFDNRPCRFSPVQEKDPVTRHHHQQQSRASYQTEKTSSGSQQQSSAHFSSKTKQQANNTAVFDSPASVSKSSRAHKSFYHSSDPKSDQDVTVTSTTSITLPPELVSISSNHNKAITMVDKETDILSDWANTDDDGEDEIETDDHDEGATPTPSTPDTDAGGRGVFSHSRSPSTATDIDFGDSSAATAASSTGIITIPSSSSIRHHYSHNTNSDNKRSSSGGKSPSYNQDHQHNNNLVNLPTTCYQPIPVLPKAYNGMVPRESNNMAFTHDRCSGESYFGNQSESFSLSNHPHHIQQQQQQQHLLIQPHNLVTGIKYTTSHAEIGIGVPTLSAGLYSDPSIDSDYLNANSDTKQVGSSSSSHALARGALGFLRKIFKKGSCSNQRTSPGSDKVRIFRKGSNLKDNYLPNTTGLRSPLLTADALVSHPLVNRKATMHGYFLTPTPNAFRRRSGGGGGGNGTDSSDSKSSKHTPKPVKTDIIRLPPGALSPTSKGHTSSSSTTSSSGQTNIGAFCVSSLLNAYETGGSQDAQCGVGTHTNSTSASSSVHSMSTSASAASGMMLNGVPVPNNKSSRQNQSGLPTDSFYTNSKGQSSFVSQNIQHQQNKVIGYTMSPIPLKSSGPHSSMTSSGQPSIHPGQPHASSNVHPSQSHQNHHHHRDLPPHPSTPKLSSVSTTSGPCPYESPRLQNPHRINSPSFNNYSPIHRLVVTGANHLLNRGPPNPSSTQQQHHPIPPGESYLHNPSSDSPKLPPRSNAGNHQQSQAPMSSCHPSYNNNNLTTFTPIINRSVHHPGSTCSPLINHRQPISSPHHPHNSSYSHQQPPPPAPSQSFASPSPILGNPRYQYIASSNQNSPILNATKRMNSTPLASHHQNHPYHQNSHHEGGPFPQPSNVPQHQHQAFSTFSPIPPPRQNANHHQNNPFSGSPIIGASQNVNNQQQFTPNLRGGQGQQRRGSVGCEFEASPNSPNLQQVLGNDNLPGSSASNRNNMLSRSQSYQTQQVHYYASPIIPQLQQSNASSQQRMVHPHPVPPQTMLPTGIHLHEQPLLMRTHLHNQNIRLNNFLMNKQRFHSHSSGRVSGDSSDSRRVRNSESFQDRIYETVDSEDDDEDIHSDEDSEGCMDNGRDVDDDNNDEKSRHHHQIRYSNQQDGRNLQSTTSSFKGAAQSKAQQSLKSKRSKQVSSADSESRQAQMFNNKRPPVPMALFGPNTFLSETETSLLQADREADRKYKRLINEAEALLREISAVKSQQPWARRNHEQDRFQMEDCPQSDPLRRKVVAVIRFIDCRK